MCEACGNTSPKWSGQCGNCGAWGSIVEEIVDTNIRASKSGRVLDLEKIFTSAKVPKQNSRLKTNNSEIDQVLGGGFIPGSVNLLAGEPGIGKSTLVLQIASMLSDSKKVIYFSGEESSFQIQNRANRLGISNKNNLSLAITNLVDDIVLTIDKSRPEIVIVDSIQTLTTSKLSSSAGTVSQVTGCAQLLAQTAKAKDITLILIGHVTKEGSIAGPKILEHMVDVVLQLEGDRYGGYKMLRSVKNRYGSTNEIGLFEMSEQGLSPIHNPSKELLSQRQAGDGSVVTAVIEGSRAILVEVQALVNKTVFGYPKRTVSGYEYNRLNLLIAMLSRRTKLDLSDKDVYVNLVGGIRTDDPAVDLAICMAIGSAAKGLGLKKDAVIFGEVGLSGEIRHVQMLKKRVEEAKKLGFDLVIGPRSKENLGKIYSQEVNIKDTLNKYLSYGN